MKPFDPTLPPLLCGPMPTTQAERDRDQVDRNRRRLNAWRLKFIASQGREPAMTKPRPPLRRPHPAAVSTETRNSNSTVIKMPRHRGQYHGANLPTQPDGPEAA